MFHYFRLASDHLAIAALESPDSATRPDVDVMNSFRFQFASTSNIVDVEGVAAVDDDVVRSQHREKLIENRIDQCDRYHQPNRTRGPELRDEIVERRSSN